MSDSPNLLIQANNPIALKQLITTHNLAGKIDLIYIDPPFATNNTFTITDGGANTISNNTSRTAMYLDNLKGFDFIEFIRERLVLLKTLLSDKGSIYLHIDYKIGYYVKNSDGRSFRYRKLPKRHYTHKMQPEEFCLQRLRKHKRLNYN